MSSDPYRPPAANLEAPRPERGPAPRSVKLAVALLLFSAACSIAITLAMLAGVLPSPASPSPAMDAASAGLGLVINIFLAYKIYTGRNWARWVFTILWLLGTIGLMLSFTFLRTLGSEEVWKSVPWTTWIGAGIQTLIQVVAIVCLFLGESSKWFRQQ